MRFYAFQCVSSASPIRFSEKSKERLQNKKRRIV
jgi:hypothetical protein